PPLRRCTHLSLTLPAPPDLHTLSLHDALPICIPYRKPELARGMPDIRLRQPRLGERRTHARRLPGGVPGTMLAQVVRVRAVAHDGEPAAPRRRDEPAPQLRLAEEATVRRIREIVGI